MHHRVDPDSRRFWFLGLLMALLGLCLAVPLLEAFNREGDLGVLGIGASMLFAGMLLSGVYAVGPSRRTMIVAVLLGALDVCLRLWAGLSDEASMRLMSSAADAVLVFFVIVCVTRFLFRGVRVTLNVLAAALCVYLLIAVFFASLYGIIGILDESAFAHPPSDQAPFTDQNEGSTLYFSLVTITTLGFGDITPRTSLARMLVAIQAVIGQIYLTVLVARLVGLHIAEGRLRTTPREP